MNHTMSLSVSQIISARTDEEIINLISADLNARLPEEIRENDDALLRAMQQLPRGLRAMAAIHRLDVSVALDDLTWHFYNNYSQDFARETLSGLRELGAFEEAEIFERALSLVRPHWEKIGELREQRKTDESPEALNDWYNCYESSGVAAEMLPLDKRLWEICAASPGNSLLSYWASYARKHPERLVEEDSCPH